MDSYEGTAALEWWANRSTCLGEFTVRVAIRVSGDDWTCAAHLEPPLSAEDRESFDFLMELEPVFLLRLDDDGALPVTVAAAPSGEATHLVLTAFEPQGAPAGTRRLPL
ncbi:hypothetical protein ABZ901_22215 [Actinacidiphila alni]|uniref:hypothetical protein n=1 Tax=Actinacidiphila alni TaxID=380248 RepID=UPI0033E987BE